jgi:DNA-binding transcriptional MerR regulator
MYTIKQAAARTGVPIALLRAWERRYHVVSPERTASGYRLYDDDALERIRSMRRLVDGGWSPSVAAAAILRGEAPHADPAASAGVDATAGGASSAGIEDVSQTSGDPGSERLIERFVSAAIALDIYRLELTLDRMFAAGTFETVVDALALPALRAIGDAWADDRLGVAGEHAASHAMLRRLAAAFQAAGRPAETLGAILVGLPPGGRHELAALAFSVAARRAGLPVLYLGPDLPVDDWVATALRTHARAAVIGSPTSADVGPAVDVGRALRTADPALAIAVGGRHAEQTRDVLGGSPRIILLPDRMTAAVDTLAAALDLRPGKV